MRITKINIKKFRKLENVVEENLGLINELYGSNASGKTSFISFISWMIYGETLDYGKNDDMNIDTYKPNELIGGEITFSNDEKTLILAREYGYNENNSKVQNFFINGRKARNQQEYYAKINECFNLTKVSNVKIKGFNLQRALSDPYYLPNNENQFREFVTYLLNLDTYNVLFNTTDKYASIRADYDFQDKDFENCKEFYNQSLNRIEKDLTPINYFIEEYSKIKVDENELENLTKELNKVKSNNYNFDVSNEIVIKSNELNDIAIKLAESRNKDLLERPISEDEKKYKQLIKEYNDMVDSYNKDVNDNRLKEFKISSLTNELNELKEKLEKVKNSQFEEIKCPNCQTLINENDYRLFNKNKVATIKELKEKINNINNQVQKIVLEDLKALENELITRREQIDTLKGILNTNTTIYSSEETKRLEREYQALYDDVVSLQKENEEKAFVFEQERQQKVQELESKIDNILFEKSKINQLSMYNEEKRNLLQAKSVYELRLSLLKEFKNEEVRLIKNKTNEIFGDDFEFEMIVKNKTNDNYKKVCYASIDGLEHSKSNTAKYLKYAIMLMEKLKSYIGNCDIPIIFDISDNIGKTARNDIFDTIKNSQIFYTRICDEDNCARKLNVIK